MSQTFAPAQHRLRILIKGVVQGVGFRPFIYSLANRSGLNGLVLNNTKGVIIEVEGGRTELERFVSDIKQEAPPLSRIENMQVRTLPFAGYRTFTIKPSSSLPAEASAQAGEREKFVLISPDIATCDKCLEELFNPSDRRFHYPFINCTNCGPRFTIIRDVPYDRPKTTMEKFLMCDTCQEEYEDPLDRRFHAQPNACPECGPEVRLVESSELRVESKGEEAISKTVELLKGGQIVAVKGLGGFHLACDALNETTVRILRKRKSRKSKPFALMAKDLATIRKYCEVSLEEEKILLSPRRPIVLLRKRVDISEIAPNNRYLGFMLPYTPLHHLLFNLPTAYCVLPTVLVMTSGNLCAEPITYKDEETFTRLGNIADYFLTHNREIHMRCDDSVVRSFEGSEIMVRRSRGYVPEPIELPFRVNRHILACGAELKNTFCLVRDNYAFLSHYIGDLENLETLQAFKEGIEHFKPLFSINPSIIAYDLHPEYLSTKYAKHVPITPACQSEAAGRDYRSPITVPVQHHHAHIASCMADNGLKEKVIGVAFDGLGYGLDGNLWGGEFLIADYSNFKRVGWLQYIPMPGGSAAIKEPWRMAASYLYHIYGDGFLKLRIEFTDNIDREKWGVLKNLIIHKINSPLTSSLGRLFDAVSALLGVCRFSTYEGQAAMELESIACEDCSSPYNYELVADTSAVIVKPDKIFMDIIEEVRNKTPREIISARFHATVADIIVRVCLRARNSFSLNKVALSGGVFQNMILLQQAIKLLRDEGFEVYIPQRVPVNDGGISLGQAVIASSISNSKIKNENAKW